MPKLRSPLGAIFLTVAVTSLVACAPSTQSPVAPNSGDGSSQEESYTGRDKTDDLDDSADTDGDDRAVRERVDCAGAAVTVADSAAEYELRGVCPQITIEGNDLEVELEGAETRAIVMRGDRIDVDAGDVSSVSISGQSNSVDAASLGSLDIAGSRNEVDIDGIVGSVVINGDDNNVDGREIGNVNDSGSRNEMRRD
ncbi:hypothetical protein [Microbacterium sp. R86528]|uniref:hypothetical protein n=1 Tax=Microbacterium sp. R86528 TaxID=3093864 RepID=UPI0037C77AC1